MSGNELTVIEGEFVELGSLRAAGPVAIVQQATEIATELSKVIDSRKLYSKIQGKKFVKVEGWTTLGAMLGVLPREISVTRLEDGGYEAVVELVRTNDGMVIGRGSALCGIDEKRWSKADEYARRSMAITRATGKAYRLGFSWIVTLAGYEPTPAEEMPQQAATPRKPPQQRRTQKAAPPPSASPPAEPVEVTLDMAMEMVSPKGKAFGEMAKKELSGVLDWATAHEAHPMAPKFKAAAELLIEYLDAADAAADAEGSDEESQS